MLYYHSYTESFAATVLAKHGAGVLVIDDKGTYYYINCRLRPGTSVFCTLLKKDARYQFPLAVLDGVEYDVA